MAETANFICRDVLHLPRPSIIERYTNIFIVFTISGIVHLFYNWATLRKYDDLGTMAFFQSSAVLIMIEDGVQAIGRRFSGVTRENEIVPLWKKVIGFIWVVIGLAVISPFKLTGDMRFPQWKQLTYPWSLGLYIGQTPLLILLGLVSAINWFYFKVEI